jgi:hypothetical protein
MELITDTFVLVATDCPVTKAVVPAPRGDKPTIAVIEHELLTTKPYTLTLEDLLFEVYVRRQELTRAEVKARGKALRAELFAKSHACMRASPLPKKYGWGVHYDQCGKLALCAMESDDYQRFATGRVEGIEIVPAMRTKRA